MKLPPLSRYLQLKSFLAPKSRFIKIIFLYKLHQPCSSFIIDKCLQVHLKKSSFSYLLPYSDHTHLVYFLFSDQQ
jgi:hypothetical protein